MNVPPGDWVLSGDKRGFLTGAYKASKYEPKGDPLTVRANDKLTDLVLALARQAAIAGRVLDSDGEPVEGARVIALKVKYSNGIPLWYEVGSATTMDNGAYRIPRLAAGRYLIKCGLTEIDVAGVKTTYGAVFYPTAREPSMANEVVVRADSGEISGIDLRITPTPVYHVAGRLAPDPQRDLGRVFLLNREYPFSTLAEQRVDRGDYLFSFDRVPPGSYLLYGQYRDSLAVIPVDVKDDDIDHLLLSPSPAEVRGTLKLKNGGRQADLRSVSVTIQPRAPHGPGPVRISPDLNFGYSFLRIDGLLFDVKISQLPEGCYIASVQYGGSEVLESGAPYLSGATLDITIGSDGTTVEGSAMDSYERGREGAVIALIPADGRSATRSTKSGLQGSFRLAGVPPGEYRLLAWDDVGQDDLQDPAFVRSFQNQGAAVNLTSNGTANVSVRVMVQSAVR